jgi:hypothetical protein
MDDMAYASYSSTKIRSNHMTFNDGMWYQARTFHKLIRI